MLITSWAGHCLGFVTWLVDARPVLLVTLLTGGVACLVIDMFVRIKLQQSLDDKKQLVVIYLQLLLI